MNFPTTPPLRRRAGAALALVLLASTLAPLGAAGDEIADKRAEAERIARQLEEQNRRISMLAEDYDEARLEVAEVEAALTTAQDRVGRTDREVGDIRRRLREQAVQSYIRGGASQAVELLMNTRSSDELAVRSQYVSTVTGRQVEILDQLRAVRLQLDEEHRSLRSAREAARAAAADVESRRQQAVAAQADQEATLRRVQGELGELVAAEARRRAEEEVRRVQAELAAKREREAAAAREAARQAALREQAARDAAARDAAARAAATTTTRPAVRLLPPPTTAPPAAGPAPAPSPGAAAAIAEARRQIGKPYEWGADGPDSFDCSGLTQWAWAAGGKYLPHSSRAQYTATSRVSVESIQPGDLIFYGNPIHHVGLYIGDGQMIEASETGTPVRYASIYRRDLVGVGRVN